MTFAKRRSCAGCGIHIGCHIRHSPGQPVRINDLCQAQELCRLWYPHWLSYPASAWATRKDKCPLLSAGVVQVVVSTLAVISGIAAMDWHQRHGMDGKPSIAAGLLQVIPVGI